jgi:hypothetical protein
MTILQYGIYNQNDEEFCIFLNPMNCNISIRKLDCRHANIISLDGIVRNKFNVILVMEYCSKGSVLNIDDDLRVSMQTLNAGDGSQFFKLSENMNLCLAGDGVGGRPQIPILLA